ncbi:purine-cytosine permease family protein [Rossellomorea vietnamensis]|uniref:Cytosine permease n=1 Tax=Rossellomorea aquimaris TaxID=189382 RepID=A0A5D4UA38_9BACI|nr:cytosine permease [Rossellomorea aquimaris]TYS84163.1 cytosine permease [Rossellomorea aquimaris]
MKKPMIERLGLESVPQHLKTTTWFEYFIIQLAFSVNAGNFLVPALAVMEGGLSMIWAIVSTLLGGSIAFLFVSLLSLPGARYGLPAQYVIRSMIGTKLSRLVASPVRSLTSLYWFSVQTIGGTLVVLSLVKKATGLQLPLVPIAISLALIMTILALIGFEAVKKATKMFMPFLLIGQAAILVIFITTAAEGIGSNVLVSGGGFSFGAFVFFASLAFVQYVSGVSASSDITRYAKSGKQGFWGLFSGNVFGFFITALLGTFSAALFQNSNPFVAATEQTGSTLLTILIGICAMVSMISINLSNAYTGGYSLLNAVPSLGRVRSALAFGAAGIVLSCFPALVDNAKDYISLLGAFVIPLSAVIAADYLYIKKARIAEEDLIKIASGAFQYNVKAVYTLAAALVIYFLIPEEWSPGFISFLLTFMMYSFVSHQSNKNTVEGQSRHAL